MVRDQRLGQQDQQQMREDAGFRHRRRLGRRPVETGAAFQVFEGDLDAPRGEGARLRHDAADRAR